MKPEKLESFYKWQASLYDFTRQFFLLDRKKAIKLLKLKPNDIVLDLACGTGLNIREILKTVRAENIWGIDYSKSMLQEARRKYPAVNFVQGDVSSYKFQKKFDKVICAYSLSMIEALEETIKNVHSSMKPKGVFVVLDFHRWNSPLKIPYSVFRWWLLKNGVNPEKDIVSLLSRYFNNVKKQVFHKGYDFIAVADK